MCHAGRVGWGRVGAGGGRQSLGCKGSAAAANEQRTLAEMELIRQDYKLLEHMKTRASSTTAVGGKEPCPWPLHGQQPCCGLTLQRVATSCAANIAAYGEDSSRSALTFMPPVTRTRVSLPDRSVMCTNVSLKLAKMWATPKTCSPSRTVGPRVTLSSVLVVFLGATAAAKQGHTEQRGCQKH